MAFLWYSWPLVFTQVRGFFAWGEGHKTGYLRGFLVNNNQKMCLFVCVAFVTVAVVVLSNIPFFREAAIDYERQRPRQSPPSMGSWIRDDMDADGDRDRGDNCPSVPNPPSVVLGGNSLVCRITSDCYGSDPSLLADGTPVPVTQRGGKTAKVRVTCLDDFCMMQADSNLDGIGDACEEHDLWPTMSPDMSDNCPQATPTAPAP